MKKILLLVLFIFWFPAQADLVFKVGQIRPPLPKLGQPLLVGSKKIIEVKAGRIIAKKVGETTISSPTRFEKVSVLSVEDFNLWQKLSAKNIVLKNGQIYWRNKLSFETYLGLEKVLATTRGQLKIESSVAKAERPLFEKYLRRKLSNKQKQNLSFLWEPYLQLQVNSSLDKAELMKQFQGIDFPVVHFKQKFETEALIQTLVVMAEINHSESHQFGLAWPTSTNVELIPKLTGPDSLLTSIHALESQGQGKVLAKPILIAKSGAEAEFLAGGEFPIRLISRNTKEVTWKKHGIFLKIKPTLGLNQQINLVINSEISLLDKANAVDGIPALKTNRVQSEINVRSGQTLALSGLLREDLGTDRSGLFGLASLPVLGTLFRSENFLKSRSELVVFIIPQIKKSLTQPMENLIDEPNFE